MTVEMLGAEIPRLIDFVDRRVPKQSLKYALFNNSRLVLIGDIDSDQGAEVYTLSQVEVIHTSHNGQMINLVRKGKLLRIPLRDYDISNAQYHDFDEDSLLVLHGDRIYDAQPTDLPNTQTLGRVTDAADLVDLLCTHRFKYSH